MSSKNLLRFVVGLAWAAFLMGCGAPPVPSPAPVTLTIPPNPATATPAPHTSTPSPVPTPAAAIAPVEPPPEHRIGVRVVDGKGEFFDRATGERFIPRGSNYILIAQQKGYGGGSLSYHSTFNPGLYDHDRSEKALQLMHQDGYNVVRVFLNHCCPDGSIADPNGWLSDPYMDNITDFLEIAKDNGVFVIFTIDGVPGSRNYLKIFDSDWSENFGGANSDVLRSGGVQANTHFWKDFIGALLERDAPLEYTFSYELRNELFFESNAPPLTMKSGFVKTANGQRYDMGSAEDRQRMMDEGLVFWIDTIRASILESDPSALVSVGFFWPQEPHPSRIGDPRWIRTRPAIWDSTADFIDLHPYPDTGLTFPQYVDNFEMAGMEEKPIIMGEFGVNMNSSPTAQKAADIMRNWQVESCKYGFDGWLAWTWDYDSGFYSAVGHGGVINQALAPAVRPDPCEP